MFDLRSGLDCSDLCRRYTTEDRVECADFLASSSATALLSCLQTEVDWSVVLVEAEHAWEVRSEVLRAVDADEAHLLRDRAYAAASNDFAFYFEANRRTEANGDFNQKAPLPATLSAFSNFMNSESTMSVFQAILANPAITRMTMMATRFRPGDFLSFHTDETDETRSAAFVINLTQDWNPAWGGLLQFQSPIGRIVDTFIPKFNALHLFKVPQSHSVSFVAPFAARARYAISGWLYTD